MADVLGGKQVPGGSCPTSTTTTTVLRPFVRDYPGESVPEDQTILHSAEADIMEWQWHQLNHMQATCTSLQKITMPAPHQSDFLRAGCPS